MSTRGEGWREKWMWILKGSTKECYGNGKVKYGCSGDYRKLHMWLSCMEQHKHHTHYIQSQVNVHKSGKIWANPIDWTCPLSGFDTVRWLYKMLSLGEAEESVHSTPLYLFHNYLWLINYFKIRGVFFKCFLIEPSI